MESDGTAPDGAAELLGDVAEAQAAMARDIVVPAGTHLALGAAIAVHLAATATGLVVGEAWSVGALALGVALFGVVAGWLVWRFRLRNGVVLAGFASRVVLGTATEASSAYAAGLVATTAVAYQRLWWLVPVAAVAGGFAYAMAGRRWLASYRQDPSAHARADSRLFLGLVVGLAGLGLVVLLVGA